MIIKLAALGSLYNLPDHGTVGELRDLPPERLVCGPFVIRRPPARYNITQLLVISLTITIAKKTPSPEKFMD